MSENLHRAVIEAAEILRSVQLDCDPRERKATPVPNDVRIAAQSWLAAHAPIFEVPSSPIGQDERIEVVARLVASEYNPDGWEIIAESDRNVYRGEARRIVAALDDYDQRHPSGRLLLGYSAVAVTGFEMHGSGRRFSDGEERADGD